MYNSAHMIQVNPVNAYRTVSVVFLSWRPSGKGVSSERRFRRVVWKRLEERYWDKRSRSLGRRGGGRFCGFWIQDDAYVVSTLHGIGRVKENGPRAGERCHTLCGCASGKMTRPSLLAHISSSLPPCNVLLPSSIPESFFRRTHIPHKAFHSLDAKHPPKCAPTRPGSLGQRV
jgi:hypothetical protein